MTAMSMPPLADFDRYCKDNEVAPEDVPIAFAAWLEETTGRPVHVHCETPETPLYPPKEWTP